MIITFFSNSSATSSNKSFGVAPEVFDETAKYAGNSLTYKVHSIDHIECCTVKEHKNSELQKRQEKIGLQKQITNLHAVVSPVSFYTKHSCHDMIVHQLAKLITVSAFSFSCFFLCKRQTKIRMNLNQI